jgi:hypothetical protein
MKSRQVSKSNSIFLNDDQSASLQLPLTLADYIQEKLRKGRTHQSFHPHANDGGGSRFIRPAADP